MFTQPFVLTTSFLLPSSCPPTPLPLSSSLPLLSSCSHPSLLSLLLPCSLSSLFYTSFPLLSSLPPLLSPLPISSSLSSWRDRHCGHTTARWLLPPAWVQVVHFSNRCQHGLHTSQSARWGGTSERGVLEDQDFTPYTRAHDDIIVVAPAALPQ